MKKRVIAMLLAATMVLGLTACGAKESEPADSAPATEEAAAEESGEAVWPVAKNIEIICPANAGSGTDAVCRAIAAHWSEMYPNHNFTVINEASGGYTVAYEMGRNGDADGSTILVATTSAPLTYYFGMYEYLLPEDFTVINDIVPEGDALCIAVAADSPYETLDDLVEAAKANPNTISVGSGSGNIVYANVLCIEEALGCTFRKVDGADNSERISNVLGGFNDWAPLTPAVAVPYVESGDLRILAIAQDEKSVIYPDIPVFGEFGYMVGDAYIDQHYTVCATPDMSEEMAEAISGSLENLDENDLWKQTMENVLKGYTWEYADRSTSLEMVDALNNTCASLDLVQ